MEMTPGIRDVIHYLRTKYPNGGMVDATRFLRQVIGDCTLKERLLLLYKIEKGKENDYGKEHQGN